jgi:putative SOS response-associated peptidase YedK
MCGRFSLKVKPKELEADPFHVVDVPDDLVADRYNIAPSQPVAVVRQDGGVRRLALLRWGLVPHWQKPADKPKAFINARAESADTRPVFRDAFRRRRCLVPATGFYEWRAAAPGQPKTPFVFRLPDGGVFAFAGLWDEWRGPDGEPLQTCTILTTDANEEVQPVHARMPVILPPDDFGQWLDPQAAPAAVKPLLRPYPGAMKSYAVGRWVNNPKHDDPRCLEPTA